MKQLRLIFVLIVAPVDMALAADKPLDLTFGQLLSERSRLDRQRVSVIGYFDADEFVLGPKRRSDVVVANRPDGTPSSGSEEEEAVQIWLRTCCRQVRIYRFA